MILFSIEFNMWRYSQKKSHEFLLVLKIHNIFFITQLHRQRDELWTVVRAQHTCIVPRAQSFVELKLLRNLWAYTTMPPNDEEQVSSGRNSKKLLKYNHVFTCPKRGGSMDIRKISARLTTTRILILLFFSGGGGKIEILTSILSDKITLFRTRIESVLELKENVWVWRTSLFVLNILSYRFLF